MKIDVHTVNGHQIAEVVSDQTIIHKAEDGIDLMGQLFYQAYDRIILYESQITPDFFKLQNGMAGEMLQKFSTYRVRLAIVGDFSKFGSTSLKDFIFESNKGKHIHFVLNLTDALHLLSDT